MKKIFTILIMLLLIGCARTSRTNEQKSNSSAMQDEKIMIEKINKSVIELLTEEEKQNLIKGKPFSSFLFGAPSHGIFGDGIGALASKIRGIDKKTKEASNMILKNQNTIFISYNSDILLKSIKYLAKSEEGRIALKQGRFIFIKSSLTNVSFISKSEIQKLSEEYGFKYLYAE